MRSTVNDAGFSRARVRAHLYRRIEEACVSAGIVESWIEFSSLFRLSRRQGPLDRLDLFIIDLVFQRIQLVRVDLRVRCSSSAPSKLAPVHRSEFESALKLCKELRPEQTEHDGDKRGQKESFVEVIER